MIELERLKKAVGVSNVYSDELTLNEYSRDMSFVDAVRPACVIRPRNGDDIGSIVRLARETSTPLVPVSSGFPHFRVDTVPGAGGAVISR